MFTFLVFGSNQVASYQLSLGQILSDFAPFLGLSKSGAPSGWFCSFFGDFLSMFKMWCSKWVEEASYQLLSRKSAPSHKYGNGPPPKMCIKGASEGTTEQHTCEIRQINRLADPPTGKVGTPAPGYLAWMAAPSSPDHPCHAPQRQSSHSWHLEGWYVAASDKQKRDPDLKQNLLCLLISYIYRYLMEIHLLYWYGQFSIAYNTILPTILRKVQKKANLLQP